MSDLDAARSFFQLGGWAVPPKGTMIELRDRGQPVEIHLNGFKLDREFYSGWRVLFGSHDATEILVGPPDSWDIESPQARSLCRWLSCEEERYLYVVSLPLNAPPLEEWPRPREVHRTRGDFVFCAAPKPANIVTLTLKLKDDDEDDDG